MNKNLKTMLKRRITQPSNATISFVRYLSDIGYKTKVLPNSNRHVLINKEKVYAITITGHNEDYLTCRQYSEKDYDGLVSFDESTGIVYIVENYGLNIDSSRNREMHGNKFVSAYSKDIKCNNTVLDNSLNYISYKILYEGVADEVAKNIINKVRGI